MFKIMGGDGREYGPVSETLIRQWVAEGRANGQSRVTRVGSDDWKPLADFPEFTDLFTAKTAPLENPPPPAAPAPPPPSARFSIVGGDGRTYGPVTTEEVHRWIADRRANAQTRAQREGDSTWKTLPEFPEFASRFGAANSGSALPPLRLGGTGSDSAQTNLASALVNAPAIFLIVVNAANIIGSLVSLATGFSPDSMQGLQGLDPQFQQLLQRLHQVNTPVQIVTLLTSCFCLYGAISMMNLRQHALCVVAAVLTLLPCTGCCCGLGLAAGIWALVVLAKPEVRDAFR